MARIVRGVRIAHIWQVALAALVLLVACTPPAGVGRAVPGAAGGAPLSAAGGPADPFAESPQQFFVFPERGLVPLLSFIDHAERTLDSYVFVLSDREIEARFAAAVKRGVAVRVIIEPNPSGRADEARDVFDRLKRAGVQVKYAGKPFSKTHAKSLVADNRTAWVGSFNFVSSWNTTRDYATTTDDPATVAQLAGTFDDDWNGRRPDRTMVISPASHLIVSPTNGRTGIETFLRSATKSIALEQETLDDPSIIALLAERARAGVAVTVLLDNETENRASVAALRRAANQIQAKVIKQPSLHAKLIVVDDQRMLIGSHNLSKDSLDSRREVSIVLDDPRWIAEAMAAFGDDQQERKPRAGPGTLAPRALAAPSSAASPAAPRATTPNAQTELRTAAGTAQPTAAPADTAVGTAPVSNQGGGMVALDGSFLDLFTVDRWPEKLLHLLVAGALAAAVAYRPWRRFFPGHTLPHRETADTQVMIAVAGAVMVTIIGDSVARAFGLVGLGGLIRFRSLIRDTRDAALMFLMIAIGMACGIGAVTLAVLVAAIAFVALMLFDYTDHASTTRVSVRVDEPRVALEAIRTQFPHARIIEAPNAKTMGPGAGTVVVKLNSGANGADAAGILDLLHARGVTGVRNVVLEDDKD